MQFFYIIAVLLKFDRQSAHLLCSRHSCNIIHLYSSQQWRHAKKFRFRVLVMCYLRMAVMHLPTKFCANSSIQFGVIDIFRNPRGRQPPSWIFKSCTFGTFRRVNSVVLELYIKFGSNICDSRGVQKSYMSHRTTHTQVFPIILFICSLQIFFTEF